MKHLLTVILVFIACLQTNAQPKVYRQYFKGDSFNGIEITLYRDHTYKYLLYSDIMGEPVLRGKYVIQNNKLHLFVIVPDFSEKSSISYQPGSDSTFTVQLTGVETLPLPGAVVSWNEGKALTTDYGIVKIPLKDNVHELHVEFFNLNRDSVFTVDQQKGHMVKIAVAMKKIERPWIYNAVITDWFITSKELCEWTDRHKKKKPLIKRVYQK